MEGISSIEQLQNFQIFHGISLSSSPITTKGFRIEDYLGKKVLVKQADSLLDVYHQYTIHHVSALDCYGYFDIDSTQFLVFKFHTLTLNNYISKSGSTKESLKNIAFQIVNFFEYLQQKNLFFKNLTLNKIFINKANQIKIFDFSGLSSTFTDFHKLTLKSILLQMNSTKLRLLEIANTFTTYADLRELLRNC